MSVCTFIAADYPLDEVRPSKEYPLMINVDTGAIFDGWLEIKVFQAFGISDG